MLSPKPSPSPASPGTRLAQGLPPATLPDSWTCSSLPRGPSPTHSWVHTVKVMPAQKDPSGISMGLPVLQPSHTPAHRMAGDPQDTAGSRTWSQAHCHSLPPTKRRHPAPRRPFPAKGKLPRGQSASLMHLCPWLAQGPQPPSARPGPPLPSPPRLPKALPHKALQAFCPHEPGPSFGAGSCSLLHPPICTPGTMPC